MHSRRCDIRSFVTRSVESGTRQTGFPCETRRSYAEFLIIRIAPPAFAIRLWRKLRDRSLRLLDDPDEPGRSVATQARRVAAVHEWTAAKGLREFAIIHDFRSQTRPRKSGDTENERRVSTTVTTWRLSASMPTAVGILYPASIIIRIGYVFMSDLLIPSGRADLRATRNDSRVRGDNNNGPARGGAHDREGG